MKMTIFKTIVLLDAFILALEGQTWHVHSTQEENNS